MAVLLAACSAFNGTRSVRDQRGLIARIVDPAAGSIVPNAPIAPAPVPAGALAVGIDMAAELQVNLVAAGLTVDQASVVAEGSKQEVGVAAGTVAIATLALVEDKPIVVAAGPVVKGAIQTLADPAVGLDDPERRAAIAKVVMSSTFSSLGGRVDGLDKSELLALQKGMVGSAILSLDAGGLGGDSAVEAVNAVTSGAVEALSKSVGAGDAAEAAAQVVSGAVENLTSGGLPSDKLAEMVSSATDGVVGGLALAGVEDPGSAAGAVAQASVASLQALSLGDDDQILAITEGVASVAVSALTRAGATEDDLLAAARDIATGAVNALKTAGVSDAGLGKGAGAVASGAIQGLDKAKVSGDTMVNNGAISAIVSSAATSLAQSKAGSSLDMAEVVGDVAATAISAIAKTSMASADVELKKKVLTDAIDGGTKSVAAAGMKGASALTALTSISKKSVEVLAKSGDKAAGTLSVAVVTASSEKAVSAGIAAAADAMTAASTGLATGAVKGGVQIDGDLLMSQVQASAAKMGVGAGTVVSALLSGVAVAGTGAVLDAVNTSITSGTAMASMSDADKEAVQTALAKAQQTAQTVSAGLPRCAEAFPDSLSMDAFWRQVFDAPQPVMCDAGAAACPIARNNKDADAAWAKVAGTTNCQLVLKPTGAGVVLPACSVFAGKTSVQELKPYYNDTLGIIACAKEAEASCPALPADATGQKYVVATNVATNDMCALANTAKESFVAVTCSAAGVGNGFGLDALGKMTAEPNHPRSRVCAVPSASDACPMPAPTLAGYVHGPSRSESGGAYHCRYYSELIECGPMFAGATSLTAALLDGAAKGIGGQGSITCSVASATACPAVATGAGYALRSEDLATLGVRRCQYDFVYPSCGTLAGGTIDARALAAMTVSPSDPGTRACTISDPETTFDKGPALSAELAGAGFDTWWTDGANGSYVQVVRSNGRPCSDLRIGSTLFPSDLERLSAFSHLLTRSCDVPSGTSCPTLDPSLTTIVMSAATFPDLGMQRCFYSDALPACPGTLTGASLAGMPTMGSRGSPGRGYACSAAICPEPSTSLTDGLGLNGGPAPLPGLSNRCVYHSHISMCADVAGSGVLDDPMRLSMVAGAVWACDVATTSAACPTLGPSASSGFTAAGAPGTVADAPFGRCYVQAKVNSCDPLAGTVTAMSLGQLTPQTWPGSYGGDGYACSTTNSCPNLDQSLLAEYGATSFALPSGVTLCEFRRNWGEPGSGGSGTDGDGSAPMPPQDYDIGPQGPQSVVACAAAGVAPGFAYSVATALTLDPAQLQYAYCDIPGGETCAEPSTMLGTMRLDLQFGRDDGTARCRYWIDAAPCNLVFGGATSLSTTVLNATPSNLDLGDLVCSVGFGSTCPEVEDTAAFAVSSNDDQGAGFRRCEISRRYSDCGSLASATLDPATLKNMPVAHGDPSTHVCDLNSESTATLSTDLADAGFGQPMVRGYSVGTRLVVPSNAERCGAVGLGVTIFSQDIDRLSLRPGVLARVCDVTSGDTCPALDSALTGYTADSVTFLDLDVKRCFYTPTLPACPASSIAASDFAAMLLVPDARRSYGCSAGQNSCPSLPQTTEGFELQQRQIGSGNRCVLQADAPLCSDVLMDGAIHDVWRLGQGGPLRWCDLPSNTTACPALHPSVTDLSIEATARALVGAPFNRCYLQPVDLIDCASVGQVDMTTFSSLSIESWSTDPNRRACVTNNGTCPSADVNFSTSTVPLPNGADLCEYHSLLL